MKYSELGSKTEVRFGTASMKVSASKGMYTHVVSNPTFFVDVKISCTRLNSNNVFRLTPIVDNYNYSEWVFPAVGEEKIYGGGTQFVHLNLKGKETNFYSQEQGIGRGKGFTGLVAKLTKTEGTDWTSSAPFPYFISSSGYGIVVDTDGYVEVSFEKEQTIVRVVGVVRSVDIFETAFPYCSNTDIQHRYFASDNSKDRHYLKGAIVGIQGGTKLVEKHVDTMLTAGVDISAIWIQDWCGHHHSWVGKHVNWDYFLNVDLYKDFRKMSTRLRSKGIRTLGYINPFLKFGGKRYWEAHEQGYLVKNSIGLTHLHRVITFPVAQVDLTNPKAYRWYKDCIVETMLADGFDGWMADFGEYADPNMSYFDKSIEREDIHHVYLNLWLKLHDEIRSESERDLLIFNRAAHLGGLKYIQHMWAGDQIPTMNIYDGLPAATRACVSAGISLQNMHFDIGGFTTLHWLPRSSNDLARWMEVALFSPIMRTHEGSLPFINAQVFRKKKDLKYFAEITKRRSELLDYVTKLHDVFMKEKIPMMRTMDYRFHDFDMQKYSHQYMFGDKYMVCPPTGKVFEYCVPSTGKWLDYWIQEPIKPGVYKGSSRQVVPVFELLEE